MATTSDTLDGSSATTLQPSGHLTIARVGSLERDIKAAPDPLAIDLTDVSGADTVGAWLLYRTRRERGAELLNVPASVQALLDEVEAVDRPVRVRPEKRPGPLQFLEELGLWTVEAGRTLAGLVGFFGATIIGFANVIRHPRRFRLNAVVQRFDLVGVRALGIIGLMSFLIGIVIGQQGAVQLRQFGAEVYTINLIGRLTLRELGTLMTAIMVAGRSGSAFAAQLGTMKITEEVDAMRTIGVSPIEALVIPRVMAATIMMVLLSFFAMIMSLAGGGVFVWIALDTPPLTFLQRLQEVTPLTDLWVGLIKAPIFGFLIALSGCYQGMQVKGNSEDVGIRTTNAVVQSIFLVIVLDAIFAVFFSSIGWV